MPRAARPPPPSDTVPSVCKHPARCPETQETALCTLQSWVGTGLSGEGTARLVAGPLGHALLQPLCDSGEVIQSL